MKSYNCELCNFYSNLKTDLLRHHKTKKHINSIIENKRYKEGLCKKPSKNPPKPSKMSDEPPKTLQNEKKFICDLCSKEFSRKDNFKRHLKFRCKKNAKNEQNENYKKMFFEIKNELKKEKIEFNKQLNLLIEKVKKKKKFHNTINNTINNITQNIQLNCYGSEDVSHITDKLKNEMLKIPFVAIPKMIEAVHFNNEKPENKNISLSNIRDNKVKIYSDKGWIYKDKDETINDLVNGKYLILDNHYQNIEDLDFKIQKCEKYTKFKSHFNIGDKSLVEKLKKDCELLLLNNR